LAEICPDFAPQLDSEGRVVPSDYVYVYTLLMHYTCVQNPRKYFHDICTKLPKAMQEGIAAFFQQAVQVPQLTRHHLRESILSVRTVVDVENDLSDGIEPLSESDSRNSTAAAEGEPGADTTDSAKVTSLSRRWFSGREGSPIATPPTPKTELLEQRTRELRGLRAQLETERYENTVLEQQIMENEHLINSLTRENTVKKKQLAMLKATLKNDNEENNVKMLNYVPNEFDNLKRRLMKELNTKDAVLAEKNEQILEMKAGNAKLVKQLEETQDTMLTFMAQVKELELRLESTMLSLTAKSQEIACLQRDNQELQQCLQATRDELHNGREVLNSTSELLDTSQSSDILSVTPENLANSVIDKQLREKKQENEMLREQLGLMAEEKKRIGEQLLQLANQYKLQIPPEATQNSEMLSLLENNMRQLSENGEQEQEKSKRLQAKYDAAIRMHNEYLKQLKNEMKRLDQELSDSKLSLKASTEQAQQQVKQANEKLAMVSQEMQHYKQQVEHLMVELSELRSQNSNLELRIKTEVEQATSEREKLIMMHREELAQKERELEDNNNRIGVLKVTLAETESKAAEEQHLRDVAATGILDMLHPHTKQSIDLFENGETCNKLDHIRKQVAAFVSLHEDAQNGRAELEQQFKQSIENAKKQLETTLQKQKLTEAELEQKLQTATEKSLKFQQQLLDVSQKFDDLNLAHTRALKSAEEQQMQLENDVQSSVTKFVKECEVNKQLQQELESATNELQSVKLKLSQSEEHHAEERSIAEKNEAQLKEQLKLANIEFEKLKSFQSCLEQELQTSKLQLTQMEEEKSTAQENKTQLEQQLEYANKDLDRLKSMQENFEQELQSSKLKLTQMEETKTHHEQQLDKLKSIKEKLEEELLTGRLKLTQLEEHHAEERSKEQNNKLHLEQQLDCANKELDKLKPMREQLEQELHSATLKLRQMAEQHAEEISKMQETASQLEQQLESANNELTHQKEQQAQQRSEEFWNKFNLEQELQFATQQLDKQTAQHEHLAEQLHTVSQKLEQLKVQQSEERSKEQQTKMQLEQELVCANKELEKQKMREECLNQELQTAKSKLVELEHQLMAERSKELEQVVEIVKANLAKQTEEFDNQKQQLDELKLQRENLQMELQTTKLKLEQLEAQHQKETSVIQTDKTQLKQTLERVNQELDRQKSEYAHLTEDLHTANLKLNKCLEERSKELDSRVQLEQLAKQELDELKSEHTRIEKELQATTMKLRQLEEQQFEEKSKIVEGKLHLEQQLDIVKEEHARQKQDKERLQEELKTAKAKLTLMEKEQLSDKSKWEVVKMQLEQKLVLAEQDVATHKLELELQATKLLETNQVSAQQEQLLLEARKQLKELEQQAETTKQREEKQTQLWENKLKEKDDKVMTEMSDALAKKEEELLKCRTQLDTTTRRVEKMAIKLGEHQSDLTKLQRELAQAELKQRERSDLLNGLQHEKEILQSELRQNKELANRSNEMVVRLEQQRIRDEKRHVITQERLLKLEKVRENAEKRIRDLEHQLNEAELEKVKLKLEVGGLNSNVMQQQQLAAELKAQLQAVNDAKDCTVEQSKEAQGSQERINVQQLEHDCLILRAKYIGAKEEIARCEQKLKDQRLEMEGKLEKMKSKMRTLYTEEVTRMKEKQDREVANNKAELEQLSAQNTKYEEHIRKLSNQIVRLNEKILEQQKQHALLSTKLRHLQEAEQADAAAAVIDKRHPFKRPNAPAANIGSNLAMEDEEGEVFNNTYLTDLKLGRVSDMTSEELHYRNSLQPPHLKSAYAAQYDLGSHDDDLKDGPHSLDDSMSALLSTTGAAARKKSIGTLYKRPGPPTPSKNGGRLSFGSSEPPREILREHIDGNGSAKTPARFKLFASRFSMGSIGLGIAAGLPRDE
ncbi:hypothetical protein KR222_009603, partial [Zaprionus bogoriensis]